MGKRVIKLYKDGKLTKDGLENAVKKGWITKEEFIELTLGVDDD